MATTILILIGVATAALVAFLIVNHRKQRKNQPDEVAPSAATIPNAECCGAHEICEAETLLTLSEEIIYYSDEELDEYRGTDADSYSQEVIEEFRDVLLTLQMHEVTGWLKSLQLRQIEIPTTIREEALMIVEDFRQIRMENREKKESKH